MCMWRPIGKVSAPGKVILCGEHAVVYGEDALAMAIQLRCQATIFSKINDKYQLNKHQHSQNARIRKKYMHDNNQNVSSKDDQYGLLFTGCLKFGINFDKIQQLSNMVDFPENLQEYNRQKHNVQKNYQQYLHQNQKQKLKVQYKLGLFFRYINEYSQKQSKSDAVYHNQQKQQYKIYLQSQLPMGKCLGSSAAFNTVLAAVFCVIYNNHNYNIYKDTNDKQKNPKQQYSQQINNRFELSQENLSKINKISKIFQKIEHGTPSGIDNFVSTYGGLVLYNNSKTPPFTSITDSQILYKLNKLIRLRLIDSGVQKNTKKAVGIVRARCLEQGTNQERNAYKQMVKIIGTYAGKIIKLLSHNEQGKQQKQLNNIHDIHNNNTVQSQQWQQSLFKILTQNHILLAKLGVSIPQIQQIVKQNTVPGVRAGKITGAGMGGYVLVAEKVNSSIIEQNMNKDKQKEEEIIEKNNQIITKMDQKGLIIQYFQ